MFDILPSQPCLCDEDTGHLTLPFSHDCTSLHIPKSSDHPLDDYCNHPTITCRRSRCQCDPSRRRRTYRDPLSIAHRASVQCIPQKKVKTATGLCHLPNTKGLYKRRRIRRTHFTSSRHCSTSSVSQLIRRLFGRGSLRQLASFGERHNGMAKL